ncbi:MAG: efflux RND transporter permease subunit [Acetobacteraceae bacterium]|nr:efflux RND transporter permease subunit [Acetobacteraceae bacterium]
MALNVSGWAVRNPVPPLVLFAVLTVLGLFAFQVLPITRAPNVDVPIVSVNVTEPGAAPAELETQVTKRVEDAVADVAGVKHVSSTVTDGLSSTIIELRLEVSSDRALNDVKDAIAKIRADLPRDIDEPVVERIDVVGQSIQTYAATAPGMTLEQLSWFVDDTVLRDLQAVPGVGRVERIGGVTREIRVALDPDRLAALGITASDVSRQLRDTNVDLAGGRGDVGGQEQAIRTLAQAGGVEALRESRIVLPGGREVRLADLGTVSDTEEEPRGFARLDGDTPIVAFAVYRAKGASDVDVARRVGARVAALRQAHPDVGFALVDDSVRASRGSYLSAMHALMEGGALAVLVVLLFLRDLRATLLAAVALPLSIVPAFFAMSAMGFSLNFVSLLAITLVVGILVDDAIVEIENIVRHIQMGKGAWRAAIEATDEIGLTVVAITLTIVAVFAPVSFMGGIAGQYFKQFGLTIAAAVLASLLVARLLTPLMAATLLRPHQSHAQREGWVTRLYVRLLRATLAWRWATVLAGFALFALSIGSTTLLPTGFIPPGDESRIVVSIELPPGATLEDTRARTDAAARSFRAIPEVRHVLVTGGTTPTGEGKEVRRAAMVVELVPKGARARTQKAIEGEVTRRLAAIPDMRGWFVNDRGERELTVGLLGDDPAALDQAVAALEGAMRHLPGFSNVAASAGVPRPELLVTPRPADAARLGVSTQAISEAVRVATIGDAEANLAKLKLGERLIPIRVQAQTDTRADLGALGTLPVTSATGQAVPLLAVADIGFGTGPSSIERFDRARQVTIGADLAPGLPLGAATARVHALPAAQTLPAGVRMRDGGDAEIMAEVFDSFAVAMGTGLMLVLAVLVLLLRDVFQPLTILFSLPLCLGGVILALLLTGNPISMPVVIGILMLMGVVTKNAIMLVDFAAEGERRGLAAREAVVEAGRKRARPIVMTTIAMVAGMVPSALGLGDGGEFRAPMAIGVIGGLLVSTALSLVFVPSFYTMMGGLSCVAGRFSRRALGGEQGRAGEAPSGVGSAAE